MEINKDWKVFALFLKAVSEQQGVSETQLAETTGMSRSTVNRFFNLKFPMRFDYILRIVKALELNMFFETENSDTELNVAFEKATNELGRRPDNLPQN